MAASLIDSLLGCVPLILSVTVAFLIPSGSFGMYFGHTELAILFAVPSLLWAAYYQFTKDGRAKGQSIGKKKMGLMVVHLETNGPCTRGQSALRQLVIFALDLIPYVGWLVEPIVAAARADGRRLGDLAAGTQVIAAAAFQGKLAPTIEAEPRFVFGTLAGEERYMSGPERP